MSLKDTLKQLWPVSPEGLDDDLLVPGDRLGAIRVLIQGLTAEMHPETADYLLPAWERRYGVVPQEGDSLAVRRARVLARKRATGGLSREYFTGIAGAMGYTVTITTPYRPFICGESVCGDLLSSEDLGLLWVVSVDAGGPVEELENLFMELSHPRVGMEFQYTS